MAFFNDILEKLGLKKKTTTVGGTTTTTPNVRPIGDLLGNLGKAAAGAAKPVAAPMQMVDVVAKMNSLAKANPQKLDWKVSIVDLLKLLGIDSSLTSRKQLATELGCPADLMGDSAKMNVWLHKTVLAKIAENGGNVPANLLD